ncbi:MAG: exopolysaccharide transport family protein [Flavobacteriales bacterium]|nr:exopolysaccharide transport family protein [Flavobacteriales bacterium]
MKEMQKIKRLVIVLLKGSPIIIGTFLVALFIAKKAIDYSTPMYQSMAKIKLDDQKHGLSANNLYEDLDVFATENKIETEAEILNSPLLIEKTVEKLNLDVQLYRMGRLKQTLLYLDNPFVFHYSSHDKQLMDRKFQLAVHSTTTFEIFEEEQLLTKGEFGKQVQIDGAHLIIDLNDSILQQKDLHLIDNYQFEIKSTEKWIAEIKKNLDVKAVDKEIAVLRVVFKSEDPQLSADFANTLCEVYVEDYIQTKSLAAQKTLEFIDKRMDDIDSSLSYSERNLESYRIDHNVVNTLQETETGLREISKLRLQLINMEMEEESLTELEEYMSNGDYYEETSINFGFGDLLLTELVKKLKLYTDEKKDLLLKYTPNDQRVINIQEKIDDVENYIKEAIKRNKQTIETKRANIERSLEELSTQFEDIPTREKEMRILERDFEINENVYTFLAQKKIEAQIASSALISFHRVIQPATVNKEPVSPNRVLITFVSGLLGLMIGLLIVLGRKSLTGKITSKADIEKLTSTPVIAAITNAKKQNNHLQEFASLATAIQLNTQKKANTILVTSSVQKEGKSFVCENLSTVYTEMGYRVLKMNLNSHSQVENDLYLKDLLKTENVAGEIEKLSQKGMVSIGYGSDILNPILLINHKKMSLVMECLKAHFDLILIDTPGSVISIEAASLLTYADLGLYVVRTGVSKAEYIPNVDILGQDLGFENFKIVLNGAHITTNYNGNFNGSRLAYENETKSPLKRLKYLLKIYSR